jgi:SAM-dependent methyltransferase
VTETGLADRRFWEGYWSSKDVIRRVDESERFLPLLRESVQPGARTFVELGGFPGFYAVLARKLLGLDATLVDIVVEEPVVRRLLEVNGLAPDDVEIVRDDLFAHREEGGYDVVFSSGLVEHFPEPERILAAHAALAAPGATVVVTVPNFRGLNGLLQLCCDRANLRLHNLEAMRPERLLSAAAACGLEEAEAFYYGRLELWLERLDRRAVALRALVRAVNALGRRLPSPGGRLLSPHVVLRARRRPGLGRDDQPRP